MELNNKIVVYWILLLAQTISAFFMYQKEVFTLLLASDVTGLSLLILAIHIISFLIIGYMTAYHTRDNSPMWYVSELQLGIGMTGTLIGFVIMFSTVFVGINTEEDIANAVGSIATGVGTALWTTLAGLISSLILKAGLVNCERE